jgi:hypothetical protein
MKKIWITLGISGMLLGSPITNSMAAVNISVGTKLTLGHKHPHRKHYHKRHHHHPSKKGNNSHVHVRLNP